MVIEVKVNVLFDICINGTWFHNFKINSKWGSFVEFVNEDDLMLVGYRKSDQPIGAKLFKMFDWEIDIPDGNESLDKYQIVMCSPQLLDPLHDFKEMVKNNETRKEI